MFLIMHSNGLYFHNKGRIILFETEHEAENFANMLIQYATNRLANEGRAFEAMEVPIIVMSECQILPTDSDIFNVECGTVFARELFENQR